MQFTLTLVNRGFKAGLSNNVTVIFAYLRIPVPAANQIEGMPIIPRAHN